MKTITINGLTFNDFGVNEMSCGMHLITMTNPPVDLVQQVINQAFAGVFLNPSAPCCSSEFFGVWGTPEQYKDLYRKQKTAQIANRLISEFGWDPIHDEDTLKLHDLRKKKLITSYKDWWEL